MQRWQIEQLEELPLPTTDLSADVSNGHKGKSGFQNYRKGENSKKGA